MVTQVPAGGLTSVEQSLVEHVGRGEWLDLVADGEAVDEAAMRSWGDSRTCHAWVIRDILRGRLAPDPDPHGLRLRGARISGRLDLENLTTDVNLELSHCILEEGILARDARLAGLNLAGCQIEHPSEPPLDAGRLTCSFLVLGGTRLIGHTNRGAVNLSGAHIRALLTCEWAVLNNDSGPALYADGLQVDQDLYLRYVTATGGGDDGAVRLPGARIGGQFDCERARLRNYSGPALIGDSLQVNQDLYLRRFSATGSSGNGTVRLSGAHIGGQLACEGARLRNDSGPALHADNLQVDQAMLLIGMFTGSGGKGTVRLSGARIGGQFECEGARLRNDSGPALAADSLHVGQSMHLRGVTATGSGGGGTVRLPGADIGGQLDCQDTELRNDSGGTLIADSMHVGQAMRLTGGFTATSGGEDGVTVDLTSVQVGGALLFATVRLKHVTDPQRRLIVDGLTYADVPELVSIGDWLRLLRNATPGYAAQPYQQLAAGCRALGDDRQAREVLMRQRDDQLARARPRPRWSERLWGQITKHTLGYGYQPWRALLFLAAVVAVSCMLAWLLGSHGALVQTSKTATPGQPCTVVQLVSVGLDLNLPVGTSVARAGCDLTAYSASVTAAWLSAVGWVLRVLAWAFAALFFAGFTSAVRKT